MPHTCSTSSVVGRGRSCSAHLLMKDMAVEVTRSEGEGEEEKKRRRLGGESGWAGGRGRWGGGSLFLFKEDVMGRMRGLCSNGSGVSRTMGMHDEGSVQHRVGPLVQQWGRSEPSDRDDLCSGMLMTCRY